MFLHERELIIRTYLADSGRNWFSAGRQARERLFTPAIMTISITMDSILLRVNTNLDFQETAEVFLSKCHTFLREASNR